MPKKPIICPFCKERNAVVVYIPKGVHNPVNGIKCCRECAEEKMKADGLPVEIGEK